MAYYYGHSSSSEASLKDVSKATFKQIEKMIHSTFDPRRVGRGRDAKDLDYCDISVNDIQRVNNRKIFREYCDFRDELMEKTDNGNDVEEIGGFPQEVWNFEKSTRHVDLNEIYLFHGTSGDSASQIVSNGFHTGTSNPRNLYGSGIYFTEEFTKADQYTDDRDERDPHGTELTLLLCKVLLGNAYMCGKHDAEKWKQPPCMKCGRSKCRHGWQHRYDSVLGSGPDMLFREFVVYDGRQCFPEFIIKYKRRGGWWPWSLTCQWIFSNIFFLMPAGPVDIFKYLYRSMSKGGTLDPKQQIL